MAAASTSVVMVVGDGAVEIAHSGSFRPWPVTVQTTVAPAGTAPAAACCSRPGDAGRAGQLHEHADLAGQQAVRGQDLAVGDGVDHPPDASRASSALVQHAGLPIRMAVAIVDGSGTTAPVTIGAAPEAWNPYISGVCVRVAGRGVLVVAHPVRGDVARVADRQAVDVGRVAERLDDLERRRLLAVQPVRG